MHRGKVGHEASSRVHRAMRWADAVCSLTFLVFNIPPTLCPHPERGHSFPPLPRWRWTLTCPHATPQPASLFHCLSFLVSRLSQALTFPVACHYSFTLALCWIFYGVHDEMSEHTKKHFRGGWFWPDVEAQTPLGRLRQFQYLMDSMWLGGHPGRH